MNRCSPWCLAAAVLVLILGAGCRDQIATTDDSSEVTVPSPSASKSATEKPASPTPEPQPAPPSVPSKPADTALADPCAGPQTILVDELEGERARVVETRLSGERVRTILEQGEAARPAIDLLGQRAFGFDGFTNLRTGETRPISGAKDLVAPAFVGTQPWVVSELRSPPGSDAPQPRIRVLDYVSGQTITTFDGYSPSVAPDDSILFLQPSESHADIMRWNGGEPALVKRIELSQDGPYGVSEVVSVSRDRFVYRIYDEHEYRYYDNNDAPFFAGSGDSPKEQFDLVVSADGRRAAFTERNWNELTYLVVLDLVDEQRVDTRFYGSFPTIYGDYVAFVSDPAFVHGGDVDFRQVAEFAVYAYHVPTGTLCNVATYPGVAQPH
jgi:hypothetical protein